MRAAVMDDGQAPVYGEFAEPQTAPGLLVVEVCAAALSGLDTRVARRFDYFKMPDGPFVVGREGVARRSDGRRIYFNAEAQAGPFGSMAERTLIDPRFSFAVPEDVADDVAAAVGNAGLAAWLPLTWRAPLRPGETVLILGATGISGLIAVAAARRLGAGRVIAAGRNRAALARARELGADAIVDLTSAAADFAAAYREAAGGEVDLVIDYVFGPPAEAALAVLAHYGRLVHIGSLGGPAINVTGLTLRRTCCDVLGFASYHAPIDVQTRAYAELCRLAGRGEIPLDIETRPLSEIAAAWDAKAAGSRRRQVLIPGLSSRDAPALRVFDSGADKLGADVLTLPPHNLVGSVARRPARPMEKKDKFIEHLDAVELQPNALVRRICDQHEPRRHAHAHLDGGKPAQALAGTLPSFRIQGRNLFFEIRRIHHARLQLGKDCALVGSPRP